MSTRPEGKVTKPKTKRNRKSHLTDTDRKLHHIQSEHKRRTAIREAFLKLTQIIPSLKEEDSRSEITVLSGSVEWLWTLQREYRELKDKLQVKGIVMKDEWEKVIVPEFEEDIKRSKQNGNDREEEDEDAEDDEDEDINGDSDDEKNT
ncbi:hypothetical protein WICPIJ_000587 [Wickerhamomyces pijperi]|uniref:BHLH domain-containing protein n=1 Tax=Wickerhamomyces pijperi TaxID=599730 RepID=A0A9P8QCK8_WICPI|nr:hypothetical protein WICPIJ_000587 [Wickerhamomyces pijperi]